MIIDCLADLHGNYPDMPGGDLLIIAGDLTTNDSVRAWKNFYDWLIPLKYKKKVYIAGNHDNFLTHALNSSAADDIGLDRGDPSMEYLCDSGTKFVVYPKLEDMRPGKIYERQDVNIWGSPWTTAFEGMNPHCKAFTGTEEQLATKFALIPNNVDILVTHSPPWFLRDLTKRGEHVGSRSLYTRMNEISDGKKLRILICGHIHEAYGMMNLSDMEHDKRTWTVYNCSHVNEDYDPVNEPVRIIL